MEEVRPSVQRGRHGFRAHSGKKAANGNGFPLARTVYDDVFGGPPKYTVPSFSPCVDDYAEIFRGPSSAHKTPPVPFLELADYDGEDALVTGDSYADIFGGFACDFTVSLEELLGRSQANAEKKGFWDDSAKKGCHETDGEKKFLEKIPTKMSSTHVDNSKGIASSISEIPVATESAYQQLHGIQKQLDTSTQMINHERKEDYQREMLVSELNADSECTVVVDSDLPSMETRNTNTNASIASIVTEKVAEIKLDSSVDLNSTKRTLSNDSKDNSVPKLFRHELKEDRLNTRLKPYQLEDGSCVNSRGYPSYDDYGVDKYDPRDIFLSVKEISLQTQPTELPPPKRPPPKLSIKHSDSKKQGLSEERPGTRTKDFYEKRVLPNGRNYNQRDHVMVASGTCSAEEVSKQSSPRFLDVEVDMNSAAAISAAAMKEVMEEAKAKLKLAKEFRERRRNSLKNNKKLVDREGRKNKGKEESDKKEERNKEQEEFDSAQEFFECTLEMTPEISDCEFKECCQEEHKERRPPKKDSVYPEKQSCLGLAEECAKKSLENGPKFVKESDKNRMKEGTECHEQYRHEEMEALPVDFKLQEAQRSFVLVQKCTEGNARKRASLVADFHDQKTNRREHQAKEVEVHICKVDEKMENAAVEICERKKNEKKVESARSSHVREDGMGKQNMSEHSTGTRAMQTTQEHKENEEIATENKNLGGNEGDGKVTTTGEIHQHGASLDRLETVQEFIKQEKMNAIEHTSAQEPTGMVAQEPTGWEETLQKEVVETFASVPDTHEEECSNRLRNSQEDTHEEGCSNRQSSQEETNKEECPNRWTTFQETSHEEECSNRSKASQKIAMEEEVHEDNEKAALERVQQQEKKDLNIVQEESKTNERQDGDSHGAATPESGEQDEVHENKEKNVQQEEEKLTPGDMRREIKEEEKISATGEVRQDHESSNGSTIAEVSIKLDKMLNSKKDVSREEGRMQEGNEKQKNVGQDCKGNEQQEELATACQNYIESDRTNGLKDVQESGKQEEIQKNKHKTAGDVVFQEENTNKKVVEAASMHEQNEISSQILVDGEDPYAKSIRQNNAQPTSVQEIKEVKVEAAPHFKLEEKDKILKMSHKINEIQGVEQKTRKLNENREKTEKDKSQLEKERLKKDREQEMERLMKLEEEKEREREREKDRIAVERATHEAHDKSVADAWDKVEKAAVEKAAAEAREKAEKTPLEPKVVDRTSAEGRFRAERSTETVEARERAAERAIVEKVAAEARERMERAVAERFAASLRDKQKKDNEREDGTSRRMNSTKSTTNGVQNTRDTSSNETEKRRKARFDRYQRTTERAAKALAEKKARDLLAQREQAERNRLAENLDGDVKRWSNGKEGNLRALLSTLQYILGPESGWQPVPLTEIITSAAVKRAYRKATLSVHPDKVQQRGASVQQKYICEKVFDLLKEAWNKFNSEER
ncbi:unnamed protein product [Victoria cruziana]